MGGPSEKAGDSPPAGRFRAWHLFALFVAIAAVSRAAVLAIEIVDLDEAVYSVTAREMLRGRLLYREVADHKPPLVFLYYAAAQLLPGSRMLGLRLLTHFLTIPLTALGVSAFFGHDRRGAWAGIAWLVYGAAFLGHDMLAVNCELLMMLPLAWALALLRDPALGTRAMRLVGAGFLIGVASLFKYQAAFWLPVPVIAVAMAGRAGRWRKSSTAVLVVGAGFLLPWALSLAVFDVLRAGRDFLYWNLLHNLGYLESTVRPQEAVLRALSIFLPFLVVTTPLWVGLFRLRREEVSPHARTLIGSALALSAVTACLGMRFYAHYLIPLYLPLALGAAPWLSRLAAAPRTRAAAWVLVWSIAMLGGFSISTVLLYRARPSVYVETRSIFAEMARQIRSSACREDGALFVWGFAPQFYYQAELPVASRFLLVGYTLVGHVSGRTGGDSDPRLIRSDHWDWLMADLERSQPDFILDTSRARLSRWSYPIEGFPRLWRFVRDRYHPIVAIEGVTLWRRDGCGSSPTADETRACPSRGRATSARPCPAAPV